MQTLTYYFRQIKKFPDWIYYFPAWLLMGLAKIMRHELVDPHQVLKYYREHPGENAVVVIWHNRLLFFAAVNPRDVRKRTVAVISASRDGQYIADLVRKFGVESVRGSSSRNAVQVLHNAFRTMKDGKFIAMTPDGPRGPKYHLHRGPVQLASKMNVPVIPVSVNYSSYWQLRSWDGFQIPKPWAKISYVFGEPVQVGADLSAEDFEQTRQTIENALNTITKDCA